MAMQTIINAINKKNGKIGIKVNAPAKLKEISAFEKQIKFSLPADFIEFYTICNGFECIDDIFNFISLSDINDYGTNWFCFSEYMIYSDTWGLRFTYNGKYEIFNGSCPVKPLTSSLEEFLERFLKGNVFDPGGLYEWHDELQIMEAR